MKVAVLTLPLHTNYGGILQAYALQHVLTQAGHDAVMVRFAPGMARRACHSVAVWMKQRGLLSYKHNYPLTATEHAIIRRNTAGFVRGHIRQTPLLRARRLSRMGFDAFIVGSDQVWRHYDPRYFFDFLPQDDKARRIAYAASFGIDNWPFMPDQTELIKPLAARFDALSVREESGVELCRRVLGVEAELMPDPTLLLDTEHYLELAEGGASKEGTVMSYILDRTKGKATTVEKVCSTLSLSGNDITAESRPGRRVPIEECIWPSVEEWLAGIAAAEFVVTDSFHGTVFAILFNKPFIAICNDERGAARFHSLLKIFGLEDRLIGPDDEVTEKLIKERMDFTGVNEEIGNQRRRAKDFLTKALS